MIHVQGHPAQSANGNWRSLFGGARLTVIGTPGTTSTSSNSWLPRAITIHELNHIRSAAITAAHSITLNIHDGSSAQGTLTMDDTDGTDETATFSGTLTAAASEAISEAHLVTHIQTGVTANALGTCTFVYQDAASDAVSYYCWGDGSAAIGSVDSVTGRFIAPFGSGTSGSTTEASVQMPFAAARTLKYAAVRYTTGAVVAATLEIRKVATSGAGVVQDTIALAAATTGALVTDSTLNVVFAAGDLLSLRCVSAGATQTLQINVVLGFEA